MRSDVVKRVGSSELDGVRRYVYGHAVSQDDELAVVRVYSANQNVRGDNAEIIRGEIEARQVVQYVHEISIPSLPDLLLRDDDDVRRRLRARLLTRARHRHHRALSEIQPQCLRCLLLLRAGRDNARLCLGENRIGVRRRLLGRKGRSRPGASCDERRKGGGERRRPHSREASERK